MTRKGIVIFIMVIGSLFSSGLSQGQPPPDPCDPGDPCNNPGQPVPLTGIELLVGAGIWLGVRKLNSGKLKS